MSRDTTKATRALRALREREDGVQAQTRDRLVARMAGNIVGNLNLEGEQSVEKVACLAVDIAEAILVEIDKRREAYEAPVPHQHLPDPDAEVPPHLRIKGYGAAIRQDKVEAPCGWCQTVFTGLTCSSCGEYRRLNCGHLVDCAGDDGRCTLCKDK